ncbi:potassium-transporting ATPase subunit KdpC [Xylanimonas protaetiae]|uniref:Potassium-transporting ATPase KdpC subunit n=1 Tax=Xylanimonas protaetiae TaxID=2509457 RepID=A0A4P6F3Z9_9MICO|nr:potassium-transporting ATPase subunit KdpC [Xylanimonas protaetiae]QAY70274.1 potassium-transporting ATPase subunit KdpC [Xylanimonas protaetiae]
MSTISTTSTASTLASLWRHGLAGLRVLLVLTVLLGLAYPLAMTGVGHLAFPWRADGSLVTASGERTTDRSQAVGSLLVGQGFDGDAWFHPRPSVAGDGYDTLASGGSNLGPQSTDLAATVEQRRAQVAAENGVAPADVPADAVTASFSGLDPDISPAYAAIQVDRVAQARGLPVERVQRLVEEHTAGRPLGVLGQERVDVLALNLALDHLG